MRFTYDGAEIRRRRKELLLTREHLSRYARVSTNTIGRLEANKSKHCDERVLEGIAFGLGCHPVEISPDYVSPNLPYVQRVRYETNMLRERRAELGLTLDAVGKRAGLSLECIHKMEGKNTATRDSVRRVAKALSLPLHEFAPLFGHVYPTPSERMLFPDEEFSRPEESE